MFSELEVLMGDVGIGAIWDGGWMVVCSLSWRYLRGMGGVEVRWGSGGWMVGCSLSWRYLWRMGGVRLNGVVVAGWWDVL